MATTRKAASLISEHICFNKRLALANPVGKEKATFLSGHRIAALQEKHKHVKLVFLDEYSMLQKKHLYYFDIRLRDIKVINTVFGGVLMVLVDDTAQLPSVGGIPLWNTGRRRNVRADTVIPP